MNLTDKKMIICQALAMTALVEELHNTDFLNSGYYNNLDFRGNSENYRKILERSGLGNPATMQMYLYILLVMPKEVFRETDAAWLETFKNKINRLFVEKIEKVDTTYTGESNRENIDFYNHVRNSIAHSNCKYLTAHNKCYVEFHDVNTRDKTQHCEIVIETGKVGDIIDKLKILLMEYLNKS